MMDASRESSGVSEEADKSLACCRNIAPRFFSSLKHLNRPSLESEAQCLTRSDSRHAMKPAGRQLVCTLTAVECGRSTAFGPSPNLRKQKELTPSCKPFMAPQEESELEQDASGHPSSPYEEDQVFWDQNDNRWEANQHSDWSRIPTDNRCLHAEKIDSLADDSFFINFTTDRKRQ